MWLMGSGRDWRRVVWVFDGGPEAGMMMVEEMWWWWRRRLASWMKGMRWPMPGLGRRAIWGVWFSIGRRSESGNMIVLGYTDIYSAVFLWCLWEEPRWIY
ncbi:hypothetical protein RHMOL_Rhmol02G0007700 [Rhododendron molle]|nr:hypothetical protein RHMOL_Rhmol02G0007700 [Rhododendron molle]